MPASGSSTIQAVSDNYTSNTLGNTMVTTTTGYPVVLQGGQLSVPSVQGGNPYIYHSAQEASSVQGAIPIAFGAQGAAFACSKDGMAPSEYSNTHYTNTSNYKHWFTTSFWRKVPETDVRSVPTPTSTHSRPRSATAILTTPTPTSTHSRPRSNIGGSFQKYRLNRELPQVSFFVASKICLSRQKFCRDKTTFVATKLLS